MAKLLAFLTGLLCVASITWLREAPVRASTADENPLLAYAGAVRVRTGEAGMHRITFAELKAIGVPRETLERKSFAMFYLGEPIAIQVIAQSDTDDKAIVFSAEPYHGRYMNHNVYWLAYGGPQGPEMESRTAPVTGIEVDVSHITRTLHIEYDRDYRSRYPGPPHMDRWFDHPLYVDDAAPTASVTYTLPLEHPIRRVRFNCTCPCTAASPKP